MGGGSGRQRSAGTRGGRGARLAAASGTLLWLAACGDVQSPAAPAPDRAPFCPAGELSGEQMLAVKRAEPDAPLADTAHYRARGAARAADARLNGGGCEDNERFRYATGSGDITGPASGEEMLGYADPTQVSEGLHTRQFARAFAFASACGGREGRAMLITVENALAFDSIRFGLLDRIAAHDAVHPGAGLGERWTLDNILVSATHTHSSSAGQSHYDLANIFALGLDQQALDALIDGSFEALLQADQNLLVAPAAPIGIAMGELLDAGFNRSEQAYALNPAEERAAFVDTRGREVRTNRWMTLLRLRRDDGSEVGMLNWFSVHGTSIGQASHLLSADNKGYATRRFERDFPQGGNQTGAFVAGFFQSDEGDNSPNPFMNTLTEAELHSRDTPAWAARGGGRDDIESARISGYKQYHRARELWDAARERLHGEVRAVQIPIAMAAVTVEAPRDYAAPLAPATGVQQTCEPALGISFAGGAEDGRGPFTEGQACPLDEPALAYLQSYASQTLSALPEGAIPSSLVVPLGCYNPAFTLLGYGCQMEKPIAIPLAIAPLGAPLLELQPRTMPLQIVILGNLAVIGLPWEVTTVTGRRLRTAVLDVLQDAGVDYAVIAGLSNSYIHYLTTREEYRAQNYEGASNVYGPWTSAAVEQEIVRLARHLRAGTVPASPYAAERFSAHAPLLHHLPVYRDGALPAGAAFGDVVEAPEARYTLAADRVTTVSARFLAGHPRHDLRRGRSYFDVEREVDGAWQRVASDDDWSTRFTYEPGSGGQAGTAHVQWQVPAGTVSGRYRLRHEGASADGAYSGLTAPFTIESCPG